MTVRTRRLWAGRYEVTINDRLFTVLGTEFGWHVFEGDTADDDAWVNGAYETKRDAVDMLRRWAATDFA